MVACVFNTICRVYAVHDGRPIDNCWRKESQWLCYKCSPWPNWRETWSEVFPPMPTPWCSPVVVWSGNSLIVASGTEEAYALIRVEVMNTTNLQRFAAVSLPHPYTMRCMVTACTSRMGGQIESACGSLSVLCTPVIAILASCRPQSVHAWQNINCCFQVNLGGKWLMLLYYSPHVQLSVDNCLHSVVTQVPRKTIHSLLTTFTHMIHLETPGSLL